MYPTLSTSTASAPLKQIASRSSFCSENLPNNLSGSLTNSRSGNRFSNRSSNRSGYHSAPLPQTTQLLQLAIEAGDGLIILTPQGEVIAANQSARQICDCGMTSPSAASPSATAATPALLPAPLWQQCQQLIQQTATQPAQRRVVEFELMLRASHLRVRLRWLDAALAPEPESPYLLMTLEERSGSLLKLNQSNLSDREREVWQLRIRGCSYQDIADQLYITINTVKKHIKNIHAKQRLIETAP